MTEPKLLTKEELEIYRKSSPRMISLKTLLGHIDAQAEEIADYDSLFELQWKRDQQLIEKWRQEGTGRELTMPDRNDLTQWVADKLKVAEELLRESEELNEHLRDKVRDREALLREARLVILALFYDPEENATFRGSAGDKKLLTELKDKLTTALGETK